MFYAREGAESAHYVFHHFRLIEINRKPRAAEISHLAIAETFFKAVNVCLCAVGSKNFRAIRQLDYLFRAIYPINAPTVYESNVPILSDFSKFGFS